MIAEICRSINNYFAADRDTGVFWGVETGRFEIVNGGIAVRDRYAVGQYVAIAGSVLNNGIFHVCGVDGGRLEFDETLMDEEFNGFVYSLRMPRDFIDLVERIKMFAESESGQASNAKSVRFGVQSQSFATDESGARAGWQTVFRKDLNRFRRHTPDITL